MPGFRYREEMHGGFYLLANPVDERPADLALSIEVPDVTSFALTKTARLGGTLKLEGFAHEGHTEGKLVLDVEARRATYTLPFRSVDGRLHQLRGYKQLEVLNLVDSFTLLRVSLYDDTPYEIGRAVLRFDARGNLGSLLRSIRPVW